MSLATTDYSASRNTKNDSGSVTSLSISIVTETWRPDINGVAMTCGKMADGLLKLGAHVQVIQTAVWTSSLEPDIELVSIKGFKLPFYKEVSFGLPSGSVLKKLWQTNRPDIVLLVTEGPLGYSALRVARKLQLPVVSEFHTNFQLYSKHYGLGFLKPVIHRYLKHFHNQTLKTLVPTKEIQQQLELDGFKKLAQVARGIDTEQFSSKHRSDELRKQWNLIPEQLAVIYVGRIAPEKNIDLAIRSFRQIEKIYPNAKLILVGDGPTRNNLQAVNKDFIFCGIQTGKELAEHYASADLCLFPSTTETFGNVLLEAMASGLSVVCFDYAAAKDHLQNQSNGASVTLGDEQAYIRATLALACNTEFRKSMGRRAEHSMRQYSWDNVHSEFIQTISSLIDKPEYWRKANPIHNSTETTELQSL